MKVKVAFLFLLLLFESSPALGDVADKFSETFGEGIVSANFSQFGSLTFKFFEEPGSKIPVHTLFFRSTGGDAVLLENLSEVRSWLKPERFKLDYGGFLFFRCMERRPGWFRVMIHNSLQKTLWLPQSKAVQFEDWGTFLASAPFVSRASIMLGGELKPTPIYAQPSLLSSQIKYDCPAGESFNPLEVGGRWLRIASKSPDPRCLPLESGWMRWRDDTKLLIGYAHLY